MNERDTVIKVLGAAASQDVSLMKEAEQQLKTWESNQGFHSTLLVSDDFIVIIAQHTGK